MAAEAPARPVGFKANTRRNWLQVQEYSSQLFALGGKTWAKMPSSGYLASIRGRVKGNLTVTIPAGGTATLNDVMDAKPFGMITELRVKVNGTTIQQIPGYMLHVLGLCSETPKYNDVPASGLTVPVAGNTAYQFGTAGSVGGTVNPWEFSFRVPVAINKERPIGMVLLATKESETTVEIDWARDTDMFTYTGGATASWNTTAFELSAEIFSIPADPADRPRLDLIHKIETNRKTDVQTGKNSQTFDRENLYLRIMTQTVLNNARAPFVNGVDTISLRFNNAQYVETWTYGMKLQQQREWYQRDLPQGIHVWDFMDQGIPGYADARDWINSGRVTDFAQEIFINSNAVLGSNNNYFLTVREMLAPATA